MVIKLSEDQCTLTVYGEEFQARSTTRASCDGCYFYTKPGCNLSEVGMKRGCTPFPGGQGRKGEFVVWEKKESKMKEEIKEVKPHTHAELISQWVKNINQAVYAYTDGGWLELDKQGIMWHEDVVYAIGKKPIKPPVRMVTYLGGTIEFPLPVLYKLRLGDDYFCVNGMGVVERYTWCDSFWDIYQLRTGSIHLNESSAKAQQKAFQELMQKQVNSWVAST